MRSGQLRLPSLGIPSAPGKHSGSRLYPRTGLLLFLRLGFGGGRLGWPGSAACDGGVGVPGGRESRPRPLL